MLRTSTRSLLIPLTPVLPLTAVCLLLIGCTSTTTQSFALRPNPGKDTARIILKRANSIVGGAAYVRVIDLGQAYDGDKFAPQTTYEVLPQGGTSGYVAAQPVPHFTTGIGGTRLVTYNTQLVYHPGMPAGSEPGRYYYGCDLGRIANGSQLAWDRVPGTVKVALIQETWLHGQAPAAMSEFEAEPGKEYTLEFSIMSMGRKNDTKLLSVRDLP